MRGVPGVMARIIQALTARNIDAAGPLIPILPSHAWLKGKTQLMLY